jgi:acetyl-CoA/propionyl-CoA/long-chain acyl-CoA carboxylase, biotin carboxylase, biotin carboxyl carrier protein
MRVESGFTDTAGDVSAAIGAVLVANRGEIAVRVLRTCRQLGIRGVAIFTDSDAAAPHVRAADHAIRVSDYLDIDGIVAVALAAGVTAIHPGYGFLSERSAFARAVEEAGLVLVGPSSTVMAQMGRKDAARRIAVEAGVPVVPAYDLDTPADQMIFPVLVKAAAGGGGKGMRIVRAGSELSDAIAAARREAAASFGDDTLLIETYVERGRHIEVQIIADVQGRVLSLHERDCSVQRRHQKVIEEAPAPTLAPATRTKIIEAAVTLAATVGYVNAGTVEFLLDSDHDAFYFLEMNTRLQVEHPVTEAICGGLDLVELQLRVAAGEPLVIDPTELGPYGHAIEARVYAEDPYAGFLPQAGTAALVRWPEGPGIRVDQALETGQEVTTEYDPMLGKIIASGPDRDTARRRLVEALDRTAILGLTTNVGFLRAVAAGDSFAAAAIDVAWLDREHLVAPSPAAARVVAAWLTADAVQRADRGGPFGADGWRLAGPTAPLIVQLDEVLTVEKGSGRVVGPDGEWPVAGSTGTHRTRLTLDGQEMEVSLLDAGDRVEISLRGQRYVFARPDVFADQGTATGDGAVIAPMPSVVVEVRVAPGEAVVADQVLGIVEAMKMEVAVRAPFTGTVTEVLVRPGDRTRLGDQLFTVEPAPA